jgi:hypothetical protein
MIVEESEYKGKPMLVLKKNEQDKFPFQFGLTKAQIMVEAIESIKTFVAKHEKKIETKE